MAHSEKQKEPKIDLKAQLIEIIQNTEKMAIDGIETSIKQNLFWLEKNSINEDHYARLLSDLIIKTVNDYEKTKNYYKASTEQFEFFNSELVGQGKKELNDIDRLDFIATVLMSFYDYKPKDREGTALKLDAIMQIDSLEAMVYETKSLELKKSAYLNLLRDLENEKPFQDLKENDLDEVSNKIKNPYPEIFPNVFSFQLFKRLYENYKDSNTLLADFSFIYRKMYGDDGEFILKHQKPEIFREWLSKEPFEIVIGSPFKTLDRCITDDKDTNFNTTFELVRELYENVP